MKKQFDESKHRRDRLGRFAKMSISELKERQTIELDDKVKSGAKSGALDPTSERALEHAKRMYKTFLNSKGDVPKIAKATGCTKEEIEEIKSYVFNNPEFMPDYDQAQTWVRLRDGSAIEADYIFIKHELMEINLVKKGLTQSAAHEETNKYYNYGIAIKEWRNGNLKEKKHK